MEPKTRLTIQDYFTNAGIRPKKQRAVNGAAVSTNRHQGLFGQALTSAQGQLVSNSGTSSKGLSIQAYRERLLSTGISRSAMNSQFRASAQTDLPVSTEGDQTAQETGSVAQIPERITSKLGKLSRGFYQGEENSDPVKAKIAQSIAKAAKKFNLAPGLLHAIIKAESNYQVRAVSPAGAQGLMQLMPGTAKDLGVTNPFNIDQNINGGARYLREMLDRFDGDLKLALAAYNAGPGAVSQYGGQVPPYHETHTYIQRVMRNTNQGTT